jgi:hypothetical protein
MAPVHGIEHLTQAVRADRHIGRNERAVNERRFRGFDVKSMTLHTAGFFCFDRIDARNCGQFRAQTPHETFDIYSLGVYHNAAACVPHTSVDSALPRKPVYKGTETHSLDSAFNGENYSVPGGRHLGFVRTRILSA